ncbi:MAG: hypothetical protein AB8F95_15610 [Bacteroidia bacterium]
MTIFTRYRYPSLIIIALISGLLWRIELEYHGWAALIWIRYFHWAVPIGFGLFLFWANAFVEFSIKGRIIANIAAIVFGLLLYHGVMLNFDAVFGMGLMGLMMDSKVPRFTIWLLIVASYAFVPLIPVFVFFLLKIAKQAPRLIYLLYAFIGMIISVPVAMSMLDYVKHIGSTDLIHTIKSGFIIPLWMISIGLLFIGIKDKQQEALDEFLPKIDEIKGK